MIYNTTLPRPATQSFADWYQGRFTSPSEIIAHYWQAIEEAAESIGGVVTDNIITLDSKRKYIPNNLGKNDQRQYVISDLKTSKDGTVWPSITLGTFRNGGNTVYLSLRDLAFKEWKSGESPQPTGTRADFAEWKRKAEESQKAAQEAKKEAQEAAAERARSILAQARPVASTAYTERKQLPSGAYLTNSAGATLVPIQDEAGKTVNIQRIATDGTKKFLRGGRVSGCFHVLHGKGPAILCEGYATGVTIQAATGREVIIAFSANNIPKVSRVLDGRVALVAADHDTSGTGEKYAKETGLPYLMPPTVGDWNDYAAQNGMRAVTEAFAEPAEDITPADTQDALRAAFSLVARYSRKVPGECSADDVMADITEKLNLGEDHQIRARSFLHSLIRRRRDAISKAWRITDGKRVRCADLPAYSSEWQRGITFIRAPMASGKSAHIGSPFINESMGRRYTIASTPSRALCHEQASKFGIDLYSEVGRSGYASPAMSVCVPSLDKSELQEQIGGASAFLFDEWSQSLAMLASRGVCNEADFDKLTSICSTLDAGVFTDAFLSDFDIQFVTRLMKPGLPVRIYDVADKAQGFKARHTFGSKSREWIIQDALAELHKGGKCWISCEGRRASQTIGEILRADGYRVLIVNKLTRDTPEVLAFLANAEEECLQYDAVIHSPTITSGMSITGEKHGPHFTRGFFLGGGWKLQPKTCAQMLRRVRYIKEWSIGFMPNNAAQTVTEAAESKARAEITNMTGQAIEGREAFIRDIERRDVNQRADFASAMIWLLEDMRFTIERVPCSVSSELADQVSETAAALDEATRAAIIAAPVLTEEERTELQRSPVKTPEDHHALTAFDIRAAFGIEALTPEIVDFYDEGRGVHRLRLFADACGVAYQDNTPGKALNDSGAIRRELYAYLFEGIDITGTITRQDAETIVDRVMARRFTLAAFGCVPGKWGRVVELDSNRRERSREDKDGHICPIRRPAYPMREVTEILSMMGLELEKGTHKGKAGSKGRSKVISPDRLALIRSLMGDTWPHNILGTCSNVSPTETPAEQPIFTPAKPEPIPANDTWQEEDETRFPPIERALRSEVRALLSRFDGLPSSTTGDVWLPISDELGFQKTMTVPVPDCLQIVADEYVYPLPDEPGAFFAFPFNIDISEGLLRDVRNTSANERAFILEHTDGLPFVITVPAVHCQQSAIENTRRALRLAM